jgi:hypothetical protein
MSDIKPPKQRRYRIVVSRGFWRYNCQVRWLGMWWTIHHSDHLDIAKDHCEQHAQKVIWEGLLP